MRQHLSLSLLACAVLLLSACAQPGRIPPSTPIVQQPAPAPAPPRGAPPAALPSIKDALVSPNLAPQPPAPLHPLPQRACMESTFQGSPELLHRPPTAPAQCHKGLQLRW